MESNPSEGPSSCENWSRCWCRKRNFDFSCRAYHLTKKNCVFFSYLSQCKEDKNQAKKARSFTYSSHRLITEKNFIMFRMLFFMSICLLLSIPQTSIQDESIPVNEYQRAKPSGRSRPTKTAHPMERFLQLLTEQQYKYETAYYALALKNVFPNFAKYFHEQSESKYEDVKGLIRLCQVLNFEINLQFIASSITYQPLKLLSIETMNQTNFAQFFSYLKTEECEGTLEKLCDVYEDSSNISAPLQMYLKEKFYPKQLERCKLTSDLFVQLDRFLDRKASDRSMPFSFIFFDSHAQVFIEK